MFPTLSVSAEAAGTDEAVAGVKDLPIVGASGATAQPAKSFAPSPTIEVAAPLEGFIW